MSQTLFSTTDYPLQKLIQDIDLGEVALPDIQRPFVWKASKVRDLFDSIYKGFPVGYLLFWNYGASSNGRQIGTARKKNPARLLIVDGQQRLTSLYAVMKDEPVIDKNYKKKKLQIAFRPRTETFDVASAAVKRDPEYIPDISVLWKKDTNMRRFVNDFLDKLGSHRELSKQEEDDIADAIDRLSRLTNYSFVALELSKDVDEEEVAEVFVRINSKGEDLNQADFILTLMSVFWDEGRKELERFCYESRAPSTNGASPYNHFVEPDPDKLLRVSIGLGFRRARLQYAYALLRGKDLEKGDVSEERRVRQFARLKDAQAKVLDVQNWHDYFNALKRAGFRSGDMVTSETTLFFCYLMYLIGKCDYGLDAYALRDVIARWFFMCNISRRYTGSPESTMEGDLNRLEDADEAEDFVVVLDQVIQNTLTEDFWAITLPEELNSSAAYSPTLFAYHAALNLLGARALFSQLRISELLDPGVSANKKAVERHHLFPKAYLKAQGINATRRINQIANYAFVEWADNIQIADQPPAKYYPEYAARYSDHELNQMMKWHALPEGWEEMDYYDFLEKRQKCIAQVTRRGFERLTQRVEKVQVNGVYS